MYSPTERFEKLEQQLSALAQRVDFLGGVIAEPCVSKTAMEALGQRLSAQESAHAALAQRVTAMEERLRVVWIAPIKAVEEAQAALAQRVEACKHKIAENKTYHDAGLFSHVHRGGEVIIPAPQQPPEPAPIEQVLQEARVEGFMREHIPAYKAEQEARENAEELAEKARLRSFKCPPQQPPEPSSETDEGGVALEESIAARIGVCYEWLGRLDRRGDVLVDKLDALAAKVDALPTMPEVSSLLIDQERNLIVLAEKIDSLREEIRKPPPVHCHICMEKQHDIEMGRRGLGLPAYPIMSEMQKAMVPPPQSVTGQPPVGEGTQEVNDAKR